MTRQRFRWMSFLAIGAALLSPWLLGMPMIAFAQESVDEELKALERQIEKQEAAQAEAKKKAEAEAKHKAEEERKRKEEEAARQKEEDAKKQADEEEKQKAAAERKRQEEESARQKEEEEKQKAAAERKRQEEEAARQKEEEQKAAVELARPGREFQDSLKDGSKGPAMVVIPAGSFTMGDESNGPPHNVTIAKPFAMGKFEVTYEDYSRFCHAASRTCPSGDNLPGIDLSSPNLSNVVDGAIGTTLGVASIILNGGQTTTASGNQPVNNISWDDAKAYAQWLSDQTGKHYRLPSEAEWEYAARAGTQTTYWWGNDSGSNYANCNGCNSKWDNKRTAPVGSFTANAFGLHDTAGNVREWVGDCWNGSYNNAPADGSAWTNGDCGQRVFRGGSWDDKPQSVRSAYRFRIAPASRNSSLGFRLLQDL